MTDAPGFEIRSARPEEREEIHGLIMAAYAGYADMMAPEAWAGLDGAVRAALATNEPAERIVALRAGRLVGCVMLFPPTSRAYTAEVVGTGEPELRLLAVAADARRGGVGEALVQECIDRARGMGAAALGLHTSASMAAALRLYRRMNFVRAPEHDFHPRGAELVQAFRLELNPSGDRRVGNPQA